MKTPDKWIILKINNTLYKILASWYGGYLGGDSWQMNSGIIAVDNTKKAFNFHGSSGSCYHCYKNAYGMNSIAAGILNKLQKVEGYEVIVMPEVTDWSAIDYGITQNYTDD